MSHLILITLYRSTVWGLIIIDAGRSFKIELRKFDHIKEQHGTVPNDIYRHFKISRKVFKSFLTSLSRAEEPFDNHYTTVGL